MIKQYNRVSNPDPQKKIIKNKSKTMLQTVFQISNPRSPITIVYRNEAESWQDLLLLPPLSPARHITRKICPPQLWSEVTLD